MKKLFTLTFLSLFMGLNSFGQGFIRGFINDNLDTPYGDGYLFLYSSTGNGSTPISTIEYYDGVFEFNNISSGDYYILAVPMDDIDNDIYDTDYLPTFFVNKQSPSTADIISLDFGITGLDLTLNEKTSPKIASSNIVDGFESGMIIPALLYDEAGNVLDGIIVDMYYVYEVEMTGLTDGNYTFIAPQNGQGEEQLAYFNGNSSASTYIEIGERTVTNTFQSIDEHTTQLHIFPNPATDYISIKSTTPVVSVTITNLEGKLINNHINGFDNITISNLQSGVYNVMVTSENETKKFSFIKK